MFYVPSAHRSISKPRWESSRRSDGIRPQEHRIFYLFNRSHTVGKWPAVPSPSSPAVSMRVGCNALLSCSTYFLMSHFKEGWSTIGRYLCLICSLDFPSLLDSSNVRPYGKISVWGCYVCKGLGKNSVLMVAATQDIFMESSNCIAEKSALRLEVTSKRLKNSRGSGFEVSVQCLLDRRGVVHLNNQGYTRDHRHDSW